MGTQFYKTVLALEFPCAVSTRSTNLVTSLASPTGFLFKWIPFGPAKPKNQSTFFEVSSFEDISVFLWSFNLHISCLYLQHNGNQWVTTLYTCSMLLDLEMLPRFSFLMLIHTSDVSSNGCPFGTLIALTSLSQTRTHPCFICFYSSLR